MATDFNVPTHNVVTNKLLMQIYIWANHNFFFSARSLLLIDNCQGMYMSILLLYIYYHFKNFACDFIYCVNGSLLRNELNDEDNDDGGNIVPTSWLIYENFLNYFY